MALYIPHSIFHLACLLYVRPETFGPYHVYICRTAQLTSRRCILNIYSTNILTEYFKPAAHSPFFFSSRCRLFHNAIVFGSCNIHILNKACAKILKKKFRRQRVEGDVHSTQLRILYTQIWILEFVYRPFLYVWPSCVLQPMFADLALREKQVAHCGRTEFWIFQKILREYKWSKLTQVPARSKTGIRKYSRTVISISSLLRKRPYP